MIRSGMMKVSVASFAVLAMSLASCGGDDGDGASVTTEGSPTTVGSATTEGSATTVGSATTEGSATTVGSATTEGSATTDGTATTEPAGDFDPAGVLRYGLPLNGSSTSGRLAPFASTSICDFAVMSPMYDTLLHRDPLTGSVEPGILESFEIIDGQTVELTLRSGVVFQDGQPFDAEALKAGLERNAAEDAPQTGTSLAALDTIDVVDDLTVRLNLSDAISGSIPLILTGREGMIVAPGTYDTADTAPVGAGPFRFVEMQSGQSITMEKFEDYWDADSIRLGGIELVGVEVGPPQVNAMLSGDIDMTYLTPDQVSAVEGQSGIQIAEQASQSYYKMNFDLGKAPFDNATFRQGLNHAIDRQAILDVLFEGLGSAATSVYPPDFFGYNPDLADNFTYDPDLARQLIEDSGVGEVTFTAFVPPSPQFVRLGEVIQQQFAEVGVTMELQESADIVQDYFTDRGQPAVVIIWPPRPDPADTLRIQFTPGNFANPGGYENPELTDLVAQLRATADEAERQPLFQAASAIIADNALDLPVAFGPLLTSYGPRITGDVVLYENCQGANLSKLAISAG